MSATRRILAVGLPAAGFTVFAALAFAGNPAVAVEDHGLRPAVTATPCDDASGRGHCGYGTPTPTATVSAQETTPPGTAPTRGHTGYPTPTASVDTVPHTTPPGVQDTVTPSPGGVKGEHVLPVTGAPTSAIVSLGAILVAGGAASVYYTRRRRSA